MCSPPPPMYIRIFVGLFFLYTEDSGRVCRPSDGSGPIREMDLSLSLGLRREEKRYYSPTECCNGSKQKSFWQSSGSRRRESTTDGQEVSSSPFPIVALLAHQSVK